MMHKHKRPFLLSAFCLALISFLSVSQAFSMAPAPDLYELKIYHITNAEQEARIDKYLQNAYIPALHRAGIKQVGVFKPIESDTLAGKRIYVYVPFSSSAQFFSLPQVLQKDKKYATDGSDYLDAAHDNPPYSRFETVLLEAFPDMPHYQVPDLKTPPSERIYELRSYEGPTEKLYLNKVQMFNQGGEIGLFKRLGFNAVFYSKVLVGSHMPNLMYMTTFADQASHDAHWKAFGEDPEWKKLSAMKEYQHNVSHSDILLLHPTSYSEI